jgi:hypothetical protein
LSNKNLNLDPNPDLAKSVDLQTDWDVKNQHPQTLLQGKRTIRVFYPEMEFLNGILIQVS